MAVRNTRSAVPLPLAPRPMADELLSSWMSRVGCIYNFDKDHLRHLVTPNFHERCEPPFFPTCCIDIRPMKLEIANLAWATRLEEPYLTRLTLAEVHPQWAMHWFAWDCVTYSWSDQEDRYGTDLAQSWCRYCLQEDVLKSGHCYLRRHWSYTGFGFCHRHRVPLQHVCSFCQTACDSVFDRHGSGNRICCRTCSRAFDDNAIHPRQTPETSGERGNEESIKRAQRIVMAFELDLFRALNNRTPNPRWMGQSSPISFVNATDDLFSALTFGQESYPRRYAINAFDSHAFPLGRRFNPGWTPFEYKQHWASAMSPSRRRQLLSAVVSLVVGGEIAVLLAQQRFTYDQNPPSLDWLYQWLDTANQEWLLLRSTGWPEPLRQRLTAIASKVHAKELETTRFVPVQREPVSYTHLTLPTKRIV